MPTERVRPGTDLRQTIPPRERVDRSPAAPTPSSFRDRLMQAHTGQLNERVDKALAQVDELGARLSESLSLADLRKYKQAISALFKDLTSHMVQIKSELEWDAQAWEHRTLVTVQRVDEEMEKLTEMILAQEQDRLGILAKIGEIKGMLIDVRM